MDDEKKESDGQDADDMYVIEDTAGSVEELEREMRETAEEAASEPPVAAPAPDDYRDRYIRAIADFENFRKRTDREKADFSRYATAGVLRDLLTILDNFDRALDHAEGDDEFHRGVLLIHKQLFETLQRHGLKAIDEVNLPFDPNVHEAVVREEDPSIPNHTVAAILQKGYFLHDRLLRPALVRVAVGGPEGS